MLKIRLSRRGSKNSPFYRVVAIDEHKKREGMESENLGWWNPENKSKKIDKVRIESLVKSGAVLTEAVKKLI
jgi:small subunit ribosomal protein S16